MSFPTEQTDRPQQGPAPWEGVALVFALLITLFVVGLAYAFVSQLLGLNQDSAIFFLFIGEAFLIVPLSVWMVGRGFSWRETLALYPVRWQVMASAALIAVLIWPLASMIALPFEWLLSRLGPSPDIPTPETTATAIVFGLAVAVLAPLVEEPIFRGFIMRGWLGLGAFWAILVSSLLFGVQHGQLAQLASLIVVGIFLGIVRWRSGSIVPTMVMHGIFNLISFFFLLPKTESAWLTDTKLAIASLLAIPLLALCLCYLYLQTQVEREPAAPAVESQGKILIVVSSVLVMGMFGLFGLIDIGSRLLPQELLNP